MVTVSKNADMETKELLNADAFAERLDISIMTLFRWKRAGKLPARAPWPGQRLRWREVDIKAWEDAGYPPITTEEMP